MSALQRRFRELRLAENVRFGLVPLALTLVSTMLLSTWAWHAGRTTSVGLSALVLILLAYSAGTAVRFAMRRPRNTADLSVTREIYFRQLERVIAAAETARRADLVIVVLCGMTIGLARTSLIAAPWTVAVLAFLMLVALVDFFVFARRRLTRLAEERNAALSL